MLNQAGGRILLVDDEQGVLETIAAILEREGYSVAAVSDVKAAVARLHQEPFAAVLTDLRMEDESGLSLVAQARRAWPETTVVILTGYASLQSAIEALREGAYDYLVKPCDVEELKATIARAVERSTLAQALRQRIAELDMANARLSALNRDMAARVEDATRELSQKLAELAEATGRLEEERQRREQFISMVSHELRQPLTALNAGAQMLGRPGASAGARERSREMVLAQVQRLNRLVSDLSDVSQLADDRFSLHRGTWDLDALVREQAEAIRSDPAGARIEVSVPATPLRFVGDRDRIAQVLSNLLSNALKYGGEGTIRCGLEVEASAARLSVQDRGPGIPPDRLDAIFEPYVRLPSAGEGRPRGLGLGLYIARRIVEMHGGAIWAESAGSGATFVVRLPLRPPGEVEVAEALAPPVGP